MQSETLVPNHAQLPLAYILLTRRHLKLFSLYVSAHTPKPAWIWPAGNFLLAPAQAQISPPATSCSSPQWGSTHRRFQWLPSASTHSTCKFAFASNYAGREGARPRTGTRCWCHSQRLRQMQFRISIIFIFLWGSPHSQPTRKHYKSSVLHANFL